MSGDRTILVVEDHAGIRDSLVGLLQDEGYLAVGAATGQEALRRIKGRRPSLILLDLMMPGMSGADLSAHLARDPVLAAIPIVVVTASRKPPQSAGISAVGWLQKPFDIEQLLGIVRKYVGDGGVQQASP